MTSYQKWTRFEEALQFERNNLKETIEKFKMVNADYLRYLKDNPYKSDKNKLSKKRVESTQKILDLIETGYKKYKP